MDLRHGPSFYHGSKFSLTGRRIPRNTLYSKYLHRPYLIRKFFPKFLRCRVQKSTIAFLNPGKLRSIRNNPRQTASTFKIKARDSLIPGELNRPRGRRRRGRGFAVRIKAYGGSFLQEQRQLISYEAIINVRGKRRRCCAAASSRRLKVLKETEINYATERGAYLIRAINAVL